MSFTDDLHAFREKVEQRSRDVFVTSVTDVLGSVKEGSAVTNAPGQPVDTGDLLNSWQQTFPGEWEGLVATNAGHARAIEEGAVEAHTRRAYTREDGTEVKAAEVGAYELTLLSEVGGFHSVKLTRAAWTDLVADVVRKVVG